ncbi:ABC transporter permease [Streptomyces sp. NPDC058299]|uniref:ABC transporter permease n=1 Tax=unclassified Streptomyces TaxID=2593676 RepID=UPI0036E62DDE
MTSTTSHVPVRPLPGILRSGLLRGGAEIRVFFRNRNAVLFNMLMPVALMLLFGSLFKGRVAHSDVPLNRVVVAGVLATGVMTVAFNNLAFALTQESADGTLKRLRGTPFTVTAYVVAKAALVLVLAVVQSVLILVVAAIAFRIPLPASPTAWATVLWVLLLGAAANSLLGVAVGAWVLDQRLIIPAIQFPVMVLQFISGVYYPLSSLPPVLRHIGALFPLKWMAQGMRAALLPHELGAAEPGHGWHLPQVALVLAAWSVGGLLLARLALLRRMRRAGR